MGRKENLYAREFMEYYMKLGVDHIFIYDNNDSEERIKNVLDNKYKDKISFYETKILHINSQLEAFTDCYKNIRFLILYIVIKTFLLKIYKDFKSI